MRHHAALPGMLRFDVGIITTVAEVALLGGIKLADFMRLGARHLCLIGYNVRAAYRIDGDPVVSLNLSFGFRCAVSAPG